MIAGLLPGAFYFLRETKLPPIEQMRALGIQMAVSTDCNPGTSPIASLLLAMNMACVLFRMTAAEVLRGVTVNAARALGLGEDRGMLRAGMRADLADAGGYVIPSSFVRRWERTARWKSSVRLKPDPQDQNDTATFSVATSTSASSSVTSSPASNTR